MITRKLIAAVCLTLLLSACTGRSDSTADNSSETKSIGSDSESLIQDEGELSTSSETAPSKGDIRHVTKEISDSVRIDADILQQAGSYDVVEIKDISYSKEDLEALRKEFNVDFEIEQSTDPDGKVSYSFMENSTVEGLSPITGSVTDGYLSYSSDVRVVFSRIPGFPFSNRGLAQGGAEKYLNNTLPFETPEQSLDRAVSCVNKFLRQSVSKNSSLVFGFDKETIQAIYDTEPAAAGEESLGKGSIYSSKCDDGVYHVYLPLEYKGIPVFGNEGYIYEEMLRDDNYTSQFNSKVSVTICASGVEGLFIEKDFDVLEIISENNEIFSADKAIDIATALLETYHYLPDSQYKIFSISLQYAKKPKTFSGDDSTKTILTPMWIFEGYEAEKDADPRYNTPFLVFIDAISGEEYSLKAG